MGASLQIPDSTKGQDHLSAGRIERTRHIASVQIHTERITDPHTQRYTIFSTTGILAKECYQHKSDKGVIFTDAIVKSMLCSQ